MRARRGFERERGVDLAERHRGLALAQEQGGLAAMVAERMRVDQAGMGRDYRVGERARLTVGGFLWIFFAQRLQTPVGALHITAGQHGARLDEPRPLVNARSRIARD